MCQSAYRSVDDNSYLGSVVVSSMEGRDVVSVSRRVEVGVGCCGVVRGCEGWKDREVQRKREASG